MESEELACPLESSFEIRSFLGHLGGAYLQQFRLVHAAS